MQTLLTVLAFLLLFATPAGTAAESSSQGSSGTAAPVEEFKPSTRLPADQAVAFPVDI
jgi:hypothetical protein